MHDGIFQHKSETSHTAEIVREWLEEHQEDFTMLPKFCKLKPNTAFMGPPQSDYSLHGISLFTI